MTAPTDAGVLPYQARSVFVDRVKSGDRLPYDNLLIFDGPVDRFLDIAVWVSKADDREVGLAELLQTELNSTEVAGAMTTLAALAVAAPRRRLSPDPSVRLRHWFRRGPTAERVRRHEHRRLPDFAASARAVRCR